MKSKKQDKMTRGADLEAEEMEKDLKLGNVPEQELCEKEKGKGGEEKARPESEKMLADRARSKVWNEASKVFDAVKIADYAELVSDINRLRKILVEAETKNQILDSDINRAIRAQRVARDIIDSLTWVALEDEASAELIAEREERQNDVKAIADWMKSKSDNSESVLSKFGKLGCDLIEWAWNLRQLILNLNNEVTEVSKESEQHIRDIVALKGEVLKAKQLVADIEQRMVVCESTEQKVLTEREKLYGELKRLKEPKLEIEKAEKRANKAEREAEESIKVANGETSKVRAEFNTYKMSVEERSEAYQKSNKRLAEEVNSLSKQIRDNEDKFKLQIEVMRKELVSKGV